MCLESGLESGLESETLDLGEVGDWVKDSVGQSTQCLARLLIVGWRGVFGIWVGATDLYL